MAKIFPQTRLSDRQAVSDFETTMGGGRMATSVGGPLTGRGADFIIIDDAMKPEDALSETLRRNTNGWHDNTLLSRLNDKTNGCIIIIMQRLHEDDLVGHVLETDDWEVVNFPAIMEEDTTYLAETPFGLRTYTWREGEALHPAREPLGTLLRMRAQMGEINFSAQYQQRPMPPGGAIVKKDWLQFYVPGSQPKRFERIVQSWDTANKAGELNDYSVCTTFGIANGKIYLLHVYRARLDFPALKRKVIELALEFHPTAVVIEDRASGTQIIQECKGEGFNIIPYLPPSGTDKVMRLSNQTANFESGRVLLPTDAPWLAAYIEELTGCPGAKYVDQVDSTSQALDYINSRQPPLIITDKILRRARELKRPYSTFPRKIYID